MEAAGGRATPVGAAIAESQRGCAKCRYASGGCKRCRNPAFKARGSLNPQHMAAEEAPEPQGATARAATKGKRRRKAAPGGQVGGASGGGAEPLLHALRRQLQGLQTQPDAPEAGQQSAEHPSQQLQQQKRAAEGAGAAGHGRPAKYLKPDPQLLTSLQQQAAVAAPAAAGGVGAAGAAAVAASKRGASTEPSPTSRRPAKRQRSAHPPHPAPKPDAAAAAAAAAADVPESRGLAKRPAAAEEEQRPAKFRRVGQGHGQDQGQSQGQSQGQPPQRPANHHAVAAGPGSASDGSGGSTHMEVDAVSPRKRAAAAAVVRAATGGSPGGADFLSRLEERMQQRREERRQSSQGAAAAASPAAQPHPLALPAAGSHRPKGSPAARRSPAASQGAAASAAAAAAAAASGEEEPNPRLCLWEPPASPFGLLEEELFEDPWKLLVACLLLNKTTGTQVRRVIWQLFALCPTPAAAIAADLQQVQALIQPLGLFRKRALAIQQLSHDYLYKQWREPAELFGIGKYAADAYHIFCRGRWRDVQPEDKDLRRYRDWLEQTGGLGTGLSRHRTMQPEGGPGGEGAAP